MANIYLRKSTPQDLDDIMEIIEEARALLKKDGSTQWQNGSPNRAMLSHDIDQGNNYVLMVDDTVAGTASLFTEPDPTYEKIYEGSWNKPDAPYATIHRVALSSNFRGMHLSKFMFSNFTTVAVEKGFKNMRIDTHEKNVRMQGLAKSLGYSQRGIIYIDSSEDGKRIAFELNM